MNKNQRKTWMPGIMPGMATVIGWPEFKNAEAA
jgi:hypothetical protein